MDTDAISDLARRGADQHWRWTRDGVAETLAAVGWTVAGTHGARVDFETGASLGPAYAMLYGDEVVVVECSLIDPIEVDPYDDDAIEDVEVAMYDAFQDATAAVTGVLGEPTFSDGRGHQRFPVDEDGAEWLSRWPISGGRVAIKQLHEDKELPYRLVLAFEPGEA